MENSTQPTPIQPAAPVAAPSGSKALGIWGLVLSILALLSGVAWPLSFILGVVGLVLSIVVLAKHKPGKGLGIAGVIISGIALLVIPFWIAVTIVAYSGVNDRVDSIEMTE